MNRLLYHIVLCSYFFMISCSPQAKQEENKKSSLSESEYKNQIITTETNFAEMSNKVGIAEAFYEYADENAVIKRGNDSLIYGKNAIKNFYQKAIYQTAKVEWKPDFVKVAKEGDMAYSYGKYRWVFVDSLQNEKEYVGVYTTIWQRQTDGSWKYVWD